MNSKRLNDRVGMRSSEIAFLLLVALAGIDGFLIFAIGMLGSGFLIHLHLQRRRQACEW